ncbi:glutathione S-transferase [Rhodobaculum claviforme]|uniref:Glutathione S-transferase n=1 Tax=Rhodobaculum claviforme TaxID=1549854 RepID=A0A934TI52_9RHOB|nr:glutathione S-transferase [Rhodobaculum claviforme]MBK5926305.1 glutathione S-transferase [Rhodobaculum claviforme]
MKLFHSPASPYVRKVMVVLHETGQQEDVTLVPATGTALEPGTMPVVQNPLGKLPTLERESGAALYDSRVICRFLDDRAGGRLYPPAPSLWETLTLEATADGIMDAAILIVYEHRLRPPEGVNAAVIEAQWSKIARALDALEGRWLSHLAGPLDIGHVALGCALGYLDFRLEERGWRRGRDGLAAWMERFATRPSMAATAPPAA